MKIELSKTFIREYKRLKKKHYPVKEINACLKAIIEHNVSVLTKVKDHALSGKWQGYREFHPARIGAYGKEYDGWIVVYQIKSQELVLVLVATGTHDIL